MEYEYGTFLCPNCKNTLMGGYAYWASRMLYNGKKQWLFYNRIEEKRGWICWSFFELIKCPRTDKWYDPCGCCFNPCKRETIKRDDVEEDDECCLSYMKCTLLICLYYFLLLGYLIFFLWFDIYYCFCYMEKKYVIIKENGEEKVPVTKGLWDDENITPDKYTDEYWDTNAKKFPSLFKCKKCLYGVSYQNFTVKQEKEPTEIIEVNQNETSATGINNTATAAPIIPKQEGKDINVQFMSVDSRINHSIPSTKDELFSQVVNKLFAIYPEYRNKNCVFKYNDNPMNFNLTMEQNKYDSDDIIIISF